MHGADLSPVPVGNPVQNRVLEGDHPASLALLRQIG